MRADRLGLAALLVLAMSGCSSAAHRQCPREEIWPNARIMQTRADFHQAGKPVSLVTEVEQFSDGMLAKRTSARGTQQVYSFEDGLTVFVGLEGEKLSHPVGFREAARGIFILPIFVLTESSYRGSCDVRAEHSFDVVVEVKDTRYPLPPTRVSGTLRRLSSDEVAFAMRGTAISTHVEEFVFDGKFVFGPKRTAPEGTRVLGWDYLVRSDNHISRKRYNDRYATLRELRAAVQ
jgi:hypothetical protein